MTRLSALAPRIVLAVLAALVVPAGCSATPVDAAPLTAARAFLESVQRDDDQAREEAYRLMCPEAQIALAEHARNAAALGARAFEPWEMLAEGRVVILHPPRRSGAYREREAGASEDRRIVDVYDDEGESHPMTLERVEGSWCVAVAVPRAEGD